MVKSRPGADEARADGEVGELPEPLPWSRFDRTERGVGVGDGRERGEVGGGPGASLSIASKMSVAITPW